MSKTKRTKKTAPERIEVGVYVFCGHKMRVFLVPGSENGSVNYPGSESEIEIPEVEIGIGDVLDSKSGEGGWFPFYENMLHEFLESALMDDGCSFVRTYGVCRATDARFFMCSHEELSEAIARVADVMMLVWPDSVNKVVEWRK